MKKLGMVDVTIDMDNGMKNQLFAKEMDNVRGLIIHLTRFGKRIDTTGMIVEVCSDDKCYTTTIENNAEGIHKFVYPISMLNKGNVFASVRLSEGSSYMYSKNFNIDVRGVIR